LQNLAWDGVGGIADSFDYTGAWQPEPDPGDEVDALANLQDSLFFAVINDRAVLLLSVTDAAGTAPDPIAPVRFEETRVGCQIGTWAAWPAVDQHGIQGVDNLDGLEVWGPETADGVGQGNANRFSLAGDSAFAGAGRVSVYAYTGGVSTPYVTAAQLAAAIEEPGLESVIDLDAMMAFDVAGNDLWETGDWLMFSIMPAGPFDGGEIWVWQNGFPATFLNHHNHLWDTAFDVTAEHGLENVDALEAVPEPATLALLAVALLGAWTRRRGA